MAVVRDTYLVFEVGKADGYNATLETALPTLIDLPASMNPCISFIAWSADEEFTYSINLKKNER